VLILRLACDKYISLPAFETVMTENYSCDASFWCANKESVLRVCIYWYFLLHQENWSLGPDNVVFLEVFVLNFDERLLIVPHVVSSAMMIGLALNEFNVTYRLIGR
jgi:hypothetical protein